MRINLLNVLWVVCTGAHAASKACPLDSQSYPPPERLSSEPSLQAAFKSLDSTLVKQATTDLYKGVSYSISVFSASEDDLLYQFHHTSPWVKNATKGTNKIDADSIYRIGSISKYLTMYTWLINAGDRNFYDPISDHLPALSSLAAQSSDVSPLWDEITVGDLAGQMAGLSRDCETSIAYICLSDC